MRGISYFRYRLKRMLASDKRKKCNSIKREKIRARYLEEVAHHEVGCPSGLKLREAIENIKSIKAFLLDYLVDRNGECLESVRQFDVYDLKAFLLFKEGLVRCEPYVDEISFVFDRLLNIRLYEQFEIF